MIEQGMNLAGPFIRRPVMTTVLFAALILFGVFAWRGLPVAMLPNVAFPTVTVSASLPGASAELMASAVASPMEQAFSGITGLMSVNSVNSTGTTRITLQFDLNRDINAAMQDTQAAVTQAARFFPSTMTQPPVVRQQNPSNSPIVFIGLSAPDMPLYRLDAFAEQVLAVKLQSIPGVSEVRVFGGQTYAVRLLLNPYALQAHNLSLNGLVSTINSRNANQPQGTLQTPSRSYNLKVDGQLENAAAFKHMVVAFNNGAPVTFDQVGTAEDSVLQNLRATWINQQRGIILAIVRQPDSNTVDIAKAIRAQLPELNRTLPGGASMRIIYDKSTYVADAVNEVEFTLVLASLLVAAVIWLFLGAWRQTLVAVISIPVSILGTFAVMHVLGYSLNVLTLLALTLAVGFVVDDAVVMLENIARHREQGKSPFEAALIGSREISFTILSMTLSLAAVFLPLILMGGLMGRLFLEFGATIGIVILMSGVVALSLTPMLLARLRAPTDRGRENSPAQPPRPNLFSRLFASLTRAYARSLRASLRFRWLVLLVAAGSLAGAVYFFQHLEKAFIPNGDSGMVMSSLMYPEGISFDQLKAYQQLVSETLRKNPAVLTVMSNAGQGGGARGGKQRRFHDDPVETSLRTSTDESHHQRIPTDDAQTRHDNRQHTGIFPRTARDPDRGTEQHIQLSVRAAVDQSGRAEPGRRELSTCTARDSWGGERRFEPANSQSADQCSDSACTRRHTRCDPRCAGTDSEPGLWRHERQHDLRCQQPVSGTRRTRAPIPAGSIGAGGHPRAGQQQQIGATQRRRPDHNRRGAAQHYALRPTALGDPVIRSGSGVLTR